MDPQCCGGFRAKQVVVKQIPACPAGRPHSAAAGFRDDSARGFSATLKEPIVATQTLKPHGSTSGPSRIGASTKSPRAYVLTRTLEARPPEAGNQRRSLDCFSRGSQSSHTGLTSLRANTRHCARLRAGLGSIAAPRLIGSIWAGLLTSDHWSLQEATGVCSPLSRLAKKQKSMNFLPYLSRTSLGTSFSVTCSKWNSTLPSGWTVPRR